MSLGYVGSISSQTSDGKIGILGVVTPDSSATLGTVKNLGYRNKETAKTAQFSAKAAAFSDLQQMPFQQNMAPIYGQAPMLRENERPLSDFAGLTNAGGVGMGNYRYSKPTVEKLVGTRGGGLGLGSRRYKAPTQRANNTRNRVWGAQRGNL